VPLEAGQAAPDFTLSSHTGETVSLSDLRGKKVVLFFYPKDNTSGCTKEACAFRDLYQEFLEAGAAVYGISRDTVSSHEKFAANYNLNMPLLADKGGVICDMYGVLYDKTMYGKPVRGLERSTFVIDEQGQIAKIYRKVKVDGHAEEVLDFVRSM
jgi:thioredoxin-dependent peroxiredoxin